MNTKHTPGPWIPYTNGRGEILSIKGMHGPVSVNVTNGCGISRLCTENGQANARLIAAAPDLLEALQTLSETAGRIAQGAAVIDERGFNTLAHSISVALAAIAKATNQ